MVRCIIYIFFLFAFLGCNQVNKTIDKKVPLGKNDTFDFFDKEENIQIYPNFSVDTLKYFNKKIDFRQTIIYPKIIGKEFSQLNKILINEIKRKISISYLGEKNNKQISTTNEIEGVFEENILLKMHKNKNFVSYGFLSEYSDPKAMRPFRKYFTINYDAAKQKFIYFDDYFTVTNSTDSLALKSLIYGHISNPETKWYPINNDIVFSVDNENVYFYFDMFGVLGNPMGLVKSVKRKYLHKYINDMYK